MTSSMTPTRQPLRPARPFVAIVAILLLAAVTVGGCGRAESPAQRVERLRATYQVTLTGWVVEQPAPAATPPPLSESPQSTESRQSTESTESPAESAPESTVPVAAASATPVEPAAAEDTATGDLVAAPAPVNDIELALEVRVDDAQGLPGLTVEVALTDRAGVEKEHYRVWLDTSAVRPGAPAKVAYILKEVPYTPGDLLTAAVRPDVPKAERAMYKEYPTAH
jgi:cytoskeletal protein RodZ